MEKARVLCVDDEPQVLEGLSLTLRREFDVVTAGGPLEGLQKLEKDGPFSIVLSDMRMPEMDGARFLSRVRRSHPDSVRMLLTGHADQEAAASAVNEGQIFRFLTKPCPPKTLLAAFGDAAEHHRVLTAERTLLERTLKGAVKTLTDVLALTNPLAFARAGRVQRSVEKMAHRLGIAGWWQLEVAATFSQVGAITLPPETLEKVYYGKPLDEAEVKMHERLPSVVTQLVRNIPRLEGVESILESFYQPGSRLADDPEPEPDPRLGGYLLRMAVRYDTLIARGHTSAQALQQMAEGNGAYPLTLLTVLSQVEEQQAQEASREVFLKQLRVGMVFVDDVTTESGRLLIAKGHEITHAVLARLTNFRTAQIREPLRIYDPRPITVKPERRT